MKQQGFDHDIEQVNDELPLLGTDIDACDDENEKDSVELVLHSYL